MSDEIKTIIRVAKRDRPYVVIATAALEDTRLSFRAKGLLAYLLSKPDNWSINYRHLMTVGPDGQDATLSALKELETAGYLSRRRKHISGRYRWVQFLFEEPGRNNAGVSHALNNAGENNALENNALNSHALSKYGEVSKEIEEQAVRERLIRDCANCETPLDPDGYCRGCGLIWIDGESNAVEAS